MDVIKVNATDSTNSLAREMFKDNPKMPATCVVAKVQIKGRGQRGTDWVSQTGQNLTFSIIFPEPDVPVTHQFLLSASVATSIVNALQKFNVPKLKIKWPNDIMAGNYKVGGILIENVISEGNLAISIIGIGLNVNQTEFENLPHAGSLKLVTGMHFTLEELLHQLLASIEENLRNLNSKKADLIINSFEKWLFRLRVPSTFQLLDNSFFTGIIEGVSDAGKLVVRVENDNLQEFDLKEVKLCY
ncbi:MAG TPA: biotin--[acetyl-CoA-carboxylase] ligase [Salinimicrobium sp.]|nr:biotin--[acetyl-CoA-carboxylase] ligase [Salinimicrobium sp.]